MQDVPNGAITKAMQMDWNLNILWRRPDWLDTTPVPNLRSLNQWTAPKMDGLSLITFFQILMSLTSTLPKPWLLRLDIAQLLERLILRPIWEMPPPPTRDWGWRNSKFRKWRKPGKLRSRIHPNHLYGQWKDCDVKFLQQLAQQKSKPKLTSWKTWLQRRGWTQQNQFLEKRSLENG